MSSKTKAKLSRKERQAQRQRAQRRQRTILSLVGVLFALGLVYVVWQQTAGSPSLSAAEVPDPVVGPATAPVKIEEFSDFGCPSCRAWHNAGIQAQIVAQFGDQVQFIWKDFPVITVQSPKAAEAAQCAGAQGKFWEYHDYVYEHFAGLDVSQLKQYATAVGLDRAAFDECLDNGVMKRKVDANLQEARRLRLRGAPSFVVNGQVLPAPPSYEQLAAIVQQALGQ